MSELLCHWLVSVYKLGIASSFPLTPTKITERKYVLVLSSILHYGLLIEKNYLYAPTPNGQSQSASLIKSNTPSEITFYQYQIMATSEF